MKKFNAPVSILFLLLMTATVHAQSERGEGFKSKLWYGLGVNIGFGYYNGSSQFGFGVSPMVGYKIIDRISVGPRASVFYSSLKLPGYKNINTFDTELGGFLRGRVFRGLFLQGELSNSWLQEPVDYGNGNGVEKLRYQRFNQYLGAGWNLGGADWSSEIGAYYNIALANDIQSAQSPWEYRFGLTYRFW